MLDRAVDVPDVDVHAGQDATAGQPEGDKLPACEIAAHHHVPVTTLLGVARVLHAQVVLVGEEVRDAIAVETFRCGGYRRLPHQAGERAALRCPAGAGADLSDRNLRNARDGAARCCDRGSLEVAKAGRPLAGSRMDRRASVALPPSRGTVERLDRLLLFGLRHLGERMRHCVQAFIPSPSHRSPARSRSRLS